MACDLDCHRRESELRVEVMELQKKREYLETANQLLAKLGDDSDARRDHTIELLIAADKEIERLRIGKGKLKIRIERLKHIIDVAGKKLSDGHTSRQYIGYLLRDMLADLDADDHLKEIAPL